jgi:hypothetical protein
MFRHGCSFQIADHLGRVEKVTNDMRGADVLGERAVEIEDRERHREKAHILTRKGALGGWEAPRHTLQRRI